MSSPFAPLRKNRVHQPGQLTYRICGDCDADSDGIIQVPPGIWKVGAHLSAADNDQTVTMTLKSEGNADQDAAARSPALTFNLQGTGAIALIGAVASVGSVHALGGMVVGLAAASGNYGNYELMLPYGLHYNFSHTTATTGTWELIVIATEV